MSYWVKSAPASASGRKLESALAFSWECECELVCSAAPGKIDGPAVGAFSPSEGYDDA
jgi:hypothetical protein